MTGDAPPPEPVSIVLSTVPDEATGRRIVGALLEERLVACGSLVPGATSLYRWEGEVRETGELLLLLKTRRSHLDRLTTRLSELHPYEVPEVLSLPVEQGLPAYCRWVTEETEESAA